MERIAETFETLGQQGKTGFVPFSLAGYPDMEKSREILLKLAEADVLELGFPFSDPVADGPVIQKAAARAISSGVTMDKALDVAAYIRERTNTPMIFFSYFNPIHKYGPDRFVARAKEAGLDGVLVVDLPMEESRWLKPMTDKAGIAWIYLITPTTPDSRIKSMDEQGSGFLYYVSVTGVTGARTALPQDLAFTCEKIRSFTRLPLVVGFGVSNPQQAAWLKPCVDGVVVGSEIISRIQNGSTMNELGRWMTEMKSALEK
ncbi:MAG TPA: tryptophan synthase subunit alpha [Desulfomonilaceae bacterium]|nr:tryptophan synthase subunit alpha [Desulfomonilaceae bacterium]